MIKWAQLLFIVGGSLLLNACGGGSTANNSNQTSDTNRNSVKMKPGKTYTLTPGNRIIKDSQNALIQIRHTEDHNDSTVVLLEGNATIVR